MRVVADLGAWVIGIEYNKELASRATSTVVAELPSMPMRDDSVDGVYSVLALEHIEDHTRFFLEAARVTKPGGVLALVINHPTWTAPGSTPITDEEGEVLWRPGEYFSAGSTKEPAGEGTVTFYHRSVSDLLNSAADAGWGLGQMIEQPHHELEDQAGIPRLLACRWRRRS
jgi:SAM-dependent methyltransferase